MGEFEVLRASGDCLGDAIMAALAQADRTLRAAAIGEASRSGDPDVLVRALGEQDDAIQRNAAMSALANGGARSIPALVRALRDPDSEVVLFAAGVLGRSREPAAIPHLVALLEHDDINVAQAAIDGLSQLRPQVAVEALVRALDRDPWLRFAAVHALGEIGDPRAIPALVPLLEDDIVRDAVVEALGKIGTVDALPTLTKLLRETPDTVCFGVCLRAIGDVLAAQPDPRVLERVPEWTRLKADAGDHLKARLLEVLSPARADAGDDLEVQGAAASLVSALRMRPLYTSLVLAGRHPMLRDLLQFCVVTIGPEMVPSLRQGLDHPNANVRLVACRCALALGAAELAPRLEELLSDDDEAIRAAATEGVAHLLSTRGAAAVTKRLQDPSALVREAARLALVAMDAEAVTSVLLASKLDPIARVGALQVMRANPSPRQLPFVRAALADLNAEVRCAAVEALGAQPKQEVLRSIESLLHDNALAVRRSVVRVLGTLRDPRVRELLLALIERDPDTRAEAIVALARQGDASVAAHLIEIYPRETKPVQLRIIEALGEVRAPIAEPMLVRLLGDTATSVRCAALEALLHGGSPAAIRHAIALARDPDWRVRAVVAQKLPLSDEASRTAMERLCMDANRGVADSARARIAASGDAVAAA
jgi:HEAT repeat protein